MALKTPILSTRPKKARFFARRTPPARSRHARPEDRSPKGLCQLADEIIKSGGKTLYVVAEVTGKRDLASVTTEIMRWLRRPDVSV
jgi:hypothetical protein